MSARSEKEIRDRLLLVEDPGELYDLLAVAKHSTTSPVAFKPVVLARGEDVHDLHAAVSGVPKGRRHREDHH